MSDRPNNDTFDNDGYDPVIAARMETLAQISAPDTDATWDRIQAADTSLPARSSSSVASNSVASVDGADTVETQLAPVAPLGQLDANGTRPYRSALLAAAAAVMVLLGIGVWAAIQSAGNDNKAVADDGGETRTEDDDVGDGEGEEEPGDSCDVARGPEPWITLFDRSEPDCVIVADFQRLQIWNKGTDRTSFTWVDGPHELASDDFFAAGEVGNELEIGPNRFDGDPYQMPVIVLADVNNSPTASISAFVFGPQLFGPIRVGMTLAEATEAFGHPIEVDPNQLPGPRTHLAYVVGDPYSPGFIVAGDGGPDSRVGSIITASTTFADVTEATGCRSDNPDRRGCPNTNDLNLVAQLLEAETPEELADIVTPDAMVAIGSGGYDDIRQPLAGANPWSFDVSEGFAGSDETIDVGQTIDQLDPALEGAQFDVTIGEHDHCASPPLPQPGANGNPVEPLRQISVRPIGIDTCLAWFALDLFVDGDGLIDTIRLEVWEP